MSEKVFFPYGISNFAQIVTQNYVYVDKTAYLELFEKSQEKFVIYLRPRRFGKSLFLSLLEHYYDLNRKNEFESLFAKYYIGKNPTAFANSYRILFFNFSAVDTTSYQKSYEGFLDEVRSKIKAFQRYYEVFDKDDFQDIISQKSPEKILRNFCNLYPDRKTKVFLLIDEYDHFANEILLRNIDEFKKSVSLNGYVRKFYEAIKNGTQLGVIDRFFITGVSPITLDSLTSGFNIVKNLTHHKEFEVMMGFSEKEVKDLLSLVLKNKRKQSQVLKDLQSYYNGYNFYPMSRENIYNSDMVLYFLDNFKQQGQYPRQMLDPNIAPDYGKLKAMFQVANWQANVSVLEEVLETGIVESEQIYQFSFEKAFGRKEFVNFLFYLGNLTFGKIYPNGMIAFKIPNKVISELYWQYYSEILQNQAHLQNLQDDVQRAVSEMSLSGNSQKFFSLIERLLQNLSNRDFRQFDEKYVKLAMMAYLVQANIFDVRSEREMSGGGYLDLRLFIKPNNPFKHHQFVIELKYLKKEQTYLLSETLQEAKNQILSYYRQDKVLQSKEMLHLLVVVVVKDKIFVEEVEKSL
ncbi:AAA family ATPase [Raineya sp.]|jgi:hypothetical protein